MSEDCHDGDNTELTAVSLRRELRDVQMQLELERREYSSDVVYLKKQLSESETQRREANNNVVVLKEDLSRLHDYYLRLQAEYQQFRSLSDSGQIISIPVDSYERTLMEREDIESRMVKLGTAYSVSLEIEAGLKEDLYMTQKQLAMHESIAEKSFTQLQQQIEEARSQNAVLAADIVRVKELLSVQEELNRRISSDQANHMKHYEISASQTAEIQRLVDENERLKERIALDADALKASQINAERLAELRQHDIAREELHRAAIEHLQTELDEARSSMAQGMHRVAKEKHQLQNDLRSKLQDLDQFRQFANQSKAENLKLDEQWKSEVARLKTDRFKLEQELDERLKELVLVRKERDQIRVEADSLNIALVNMEMAMQVRDQQTSERMDAEKQHLESAVLSKTQYCRSLETDKQDLIAEASLLIKRISGLEIDLAAARIDADDARRKLVDCEADKAMLQARVVGAAIPLNTLGVVDCNQISCSTCAELAAIESSANSMADNVESIDDVLATEYDTERLKYIIRGYFDKTKRLERTMKRMESKAQKRLKETDALSARYESSQVQLYSELSALRRELAEAQSLAKSKDGEISLLQQSNKVVSEKCNDLDAELDTVKRDLKSKEQRYFDCAEQLSESHGTIETLVLENRNLSSELVSTKHTVVSQARAIERLQGDLAMYRSDKSHEADELQLRLQEALAELDTIKGVDIPRMTSELQSAQLNVAKSASTINSLMSEITNSERTIAAAREAHESELNESRGQIEELHRMLEVSQQMLNGFVSKSNSSQSEKSVRIVFLEGEVERYKSIIAQKEAVIANLEHQQQDRRDAVLLMKDNFDAVQVRLLEAEQAADVEREKRKSAEATLRSLQFKLKTASLVSHSERDSSIMPLNVALNMTDLTAVSASASTSANSSPRASTQSLFNVKGSQSDSFTDLGSSTLRYDLIKSTKGSIIDGPTSPSAAEGIINKAQQYLDQRKANRAKLARSLIASKAAAHSSSHPNDVAAPSPDENGKATDNTNISAIESDIDSARDIETHATAASSNASFSSPNSKGSPEKLMVVMSSPTSLSSYATSFNIGGSNDLMKSPPKASSSSKSGGVNLPKLFPKFSP